MNKNNKILSTFYSSNSSKAKYALGHLNLFCQIWPPSPSWNTESTHFWYSYYFGCCVLLWLHFLLPPGPAHSTTAGGHHSQHSVELSSVQTLQTQLTILALAYICVPLTVGLSRVLVYADFSYSTRASLEITFPPFSWINAHSYPRDFQNCIPFLPSLLYSWTPILSTHCPSNTQQIFSVLQNFPLFVTYFHYLQYPIKLTKQDIHHPFLLPKCPSHIRPVLLNFFIYMH